MSLHYIASDSQSVRRRRHVVKDHGDTIAALYEAVHDGTVSLQLATLIADVLGPGDWRHDAACRGEDITTFYADRQGASPAPAKAICADCPVQADCLAYAKACENFGIWGGMSAGRLRRGDLVERVCADCGTPIGYAKRSRCDDCKRARHRRQRAASKLRRTTSGRWIESA